MIIFEISYFENFFYSQTSSFIAYSIVYLISFISLPKYNQNIIQSMKKVQFYESEYPYNTLEKFGLTREMIFESEKSSQSMIF